MASFLHRQGQDVASGPFAGEEVSATRQCPGTFSPLPGDAVHGWCQIGIDPWLWFFSESLAREVQHFL